VKIGIVGLGKMGSAFATRYREHGVDVFGWDADPAQLSLFASAGHQTVHSAVEVVTAVDCIISIISDGPGVRKLYLGDGGFLSRPVDGKLFIEMSTITPAMGRELEPIVTSRGADWIEAPVMGSVNKVRDGSLLPFAGGRKEAVERARSYLAPIAKEVLHIGPAGSGYTMKLCANLFMANYLQSISEALALGTSAGISLDQVLGVLKRSVVASPWLASKEVILRGGTGDMTLDIISLRKDMMAAVAAGAENGVPMPGTSGVLSALSAAVAHGEGALDLAEYAAFFREHMVQKPRTPDRKNT
jgi:3-hydroxyisobutyrate dehydrogenase-like beta-hydroxyacid dehydrogenase